ncbi:hypothetical protein C8Q79DRAFT_997720 [Trametes meyenii]|nr:hypothetical protein C8Q79DRAFT_997720 [Trametes meyenii]
MATRITEGTIELGNNKETETVARVRDLEEQLPKQLFYDGTGLPDYAAMGAGARIIPELTSETFSISGGTKPWYRRWGSHGDSDGLVGLPPEVAIVRDTNLGSCWPMKGSAGSLGITLGRPGIITAFTVDHVPQQMALRYQSAPWEGDLWGLLDSRPEPHTASGLTAIPMSEASSVIPLPPHYYTSRLAQSWLVHLGPFHFNISASPPFQTYNLSESVQDQLGGIEFGGVVFIVRDNWGNEDYMCLYRIRVHLDS